MTSVATSTGCVVERGWAARRERRRRPAAYGSDVLFFVAVVVVVVAAASAVVVVAVGAIVVVAVATRQQRRERARLALRLRVGERLVARHRELAVARAAAGTVKQLRLIRLMR